MLLKFVPQVCKETFNKKGETVPPAYSGTVTLRLPTNSERTALGGDVSLEFDADGKVDPKKAAAYLRAVMKDAPTFVQEVDLVRLSDGYAFKAYASVHYETGLAGLEMEIANRLVGDFKVGAVLETGEEVIVGNLGNSN